MSIKFNVVFALLCMLALTACSSLPNSQHINTPFGEYSYYLAGTKKPTIVFESGLADDMTSWRQLLSQPQLPAQVFAYNRAGFSGSHSSNSSRDGRTIVKELRALLTAAQLSPPFILVGHSLGGSYMELYAKLYPEDVAGVVLVDPNASKYPERCRQQQLEYCDPPNAMPFWASLLFPPAVAGEIKAWQMTNAELNALDKFPPVPLVVLNAPHALAHNGDNQQQVLELYRQVHQELAASSPVSKLLLCEHCSHYIQQDDPALVIEAINWVLAQWQQGRKSSGSTLSQ